jgi:hypothetical protein
MHCMCIGAIVHADIGPGKIKVLDVSEETVLYSNLYLRSLSPISPVGCDIAQGRQFSNLYRLAGFPLQINPTQHQRS